MPVYRQRIFYGWIIIMVITLITFTLMASPFNVVLKQLMDTFHSSRGMVSLAPSISVIAGGIAGLFVGRLLVNHSPKKFMLWGVTIGGISLLLISVTQELWQVYILYFICGLATGGAAGAITMFTLLSKWFVKKFGTASGITGVGGSIGSLIMTSLVGTIAERFGWRMTYVFAGAVIIIISVPLVIWLLKDSPERMGQYPDGERYEKNINEISVAERLAEPSVQEKKLNLSAFLKNPVLWLIGLGFAFIQIGETAVSAHLVSFFTDMKISETTAASALGFALGINALPRLVSGWLSDRISSRYVAILFLIIEVIGMLLLIRVGNISDIWLFVIVYGLGAGASAVLLPLVLRNAFGSNAFSMSFAIINIFYILGNSVGAPFAGFVFDATGSYHLVFVTVSILFILAAIALYFAFGANPRPFRKTK